ncbi:MAG: nucleotide disphospho-sugar-binding domain-containing protein [Pirellulales bacterium]
MSTACKLPTDSADMRAAPSCKGGRVLVIGDSISLAHVGRAMVAARLLESAGCKVTFATGPTHQALARQEGFEPCEIDCVPPERAIAAIRRGSHIFDLETIDRYVAADLALIEDVAPDWIVADFRLSLNISCELARMPYWNILNGYMTHYYSAPQEPPQTFPLTRLLGLRLTRRFFPALKRQALRYYAYHFNRSRTRRGLKLAGDILQVMESPHGNLIADLPEFIPCANLPQHFRYIGPLIWEPNVPEPEWLDRLDAERPCVYATMGSTGEGGMFRRALDALAEAGYQVLTTTAGQVEDLPRGVFAAKYAPGSALARRSVATVCHGGSLTIYQSLAEGVPVVAIPTFHDQETNAERLTASGLGAALHPRRWTAEDLVAAVGRAQQDQSRDRCLHAEAQIREMQSRQGQSILSFAPERATYGPRQRDHE